MGWRTTAALLALAGGLAAVLLLTRERPDERGNVSVPVLGGSRLADATVIRWRLKDRPLVEIRRQPGGSFRLAEPIEDLVSVAQLRNIAATWDSAQMAEAPLDDDEENRARTGLDAPRLVVDVTFADGSSSHLEIGSEGALGTDLFVRRDGRIYRGGTALFSALQVGLDDLRERAVFTTPVDVTDDVEVDHAGAAGARELLHLVRDGGDWRLAAPIAARADRDAAVSFLRLLLGLRIDQFPASVVRFPERPADVVVTVRGGAAPEVVRMWLDEQRNLVGRLDARGISFVSENKQYDTIFDNAAGRLRARMLVPVANVHQDLVVVVVDPGQGPRLLLSRPNRDAPWELSEPVHAPCAPTPVQELLTAINNLRALHFYPGTVDTPEYGFAAGLRVGVQELGRREPAFVRLGGDGRLGENEITYAARADAPGEVACVPKGAVDVIRRPWSEYVALDVVKVLQSVSRVVLERAAGEQRVLVRSADHGWTVAGDRTRREKVGDIVDELRDLRGKRALGARAASLGEADWTVTLARGEAAADVFVVLRVWDRGTASPLLVQNEQAHPDLVFELSPLHSDMLRELWQ